MKPLRFIASWLLYGMGHIVSRYVMEIRDTDRWVGFWYPIYNTLMSYSSAVQDSGGHNGKLWPWGPLP